MTMHTNKMRLINEIKWWFFSPQTQNYWRFCAQIGVRLSNQSRNRFQIYCLRSSIVPGCWQSAASIKAWRGRKSGFRIRMKEEGDESGRAAGQNGDIKQHECWEITKRTQSRSRPARTESKNHLWEADIKEEQRTGRTAPFLLFFSWVIVWACRARPPRIHPAFISQLWLQLIIKQEHSISTANLAAARPVQTASHQKARLVQSQVLQQNPAAVSVRQEQNDSPKTREAKRIQVQAIKTGSMVCVCCCD